MDPQSLINLLKAVLIVLTLLTNKDVHPTQQQIDQANVFISQAMVIAANSTSPDLLPSPVVIPPAVIAGDEAPVVSWAPVGKYQVSDQFALQQGLFVPATSTFEFTIGGRLIQLEHSDVKEDICNCNEQWVPLADAPLTIHYGDQIQTGTTDSNGTVTLNFHAIGIPGDHRFTYSSDGITLTDYGIIQEHEIDTNK